MLLVLLIFKRHNHWNRVNIIIWELRILSESYSRKQNYSSMSGRGRGISNAPAWMTRQNKPGGGGGSGDGPTGLPPANPDRDAFGRAPRGGGGPPGGHPGGGPPRYPPYHDRRGGPYDDRRRGSYDDRRRGGYDDRRRGGHDDWNNGPPGRRGGGRRDSFRDGGPGRDNNGGRRMNENSSSSREQLAMVNFRSYDEEQDWAEERRRRRNSRPSKFDVEPTPQQLAAEASVNATSNPGATDFAGIPAGRDFSAVPQQTRHARRLYIGHLPPNVHEQELHDFFRNAIEQARTKRDGEEKEDDQDPILSVYINHERRFCFLEFRDVGMTTACMAFDGINVNGKGKVKVKRPNDYNQIMAPKVHPSSIPVLDVSKLGIIGSNVQDGPNKVFIGGALQLFLNFSSINCTQCNVLFICCSFVAPIASTTTHWFSRSVFHLQVFITTSLKIKSLNFFKRLVKSKLFTSLKMNQMQSLAKDIALLNTPIRTRHPWLSLV